jgi:hypothetical protein
MLVDRIQQSSNWNCWKRRGCVRVDYLKAQLSPCIFNSINNIYGILKKQSGCKKHSIAIFNLVRYQLYDCGAEKVSLENEMEFIKIILIFNVCVKINI